jgi:hypothetical protein
MQRLITVERAKREISRLQEYVDLVVSYEADTIEKMIIKEYAYSNSMTKTVKKLEDSGVLKDGMMIDKQYVLIVINSKPKDQLHRILRSGYNRRIKHRK